MQLKLKDRVVLFDKDLQDILGNYNWYINSNGYVRTNRYKESLVPIYMHQLVIPKKPGFDIDHVNGNKEA